MKPPSKSIPVHDSSNIFEQCQFLPLPRWRVFLPDLQQGFGPRSGPIKPLEKLILCRPSFFHILSLELNTKNIYCAGFSTQNWAVPFFEYFLLISLYLLISTATEHLYKSGIQDRQNKVWESDSNMLTLLTLSTTFVGPTLEKSYQAASHFCSGMALMLGPNFVGFDLKARRLYPTNMGFNPLDSIPRGMLK